MSPRPDAARRRRTFVVVVMCAVALGTAPCGDAASADASTPLDERGWSWPVVPFRLHRTYGAPAHEYGPGHRGIDLRPIGDPVVQAPAGGVVAFAGAVAGRGILTIDHGDGLVTTLEPVTAEVEAGVVVERGDPVGSLALGGHTDSGTLHFGVRRDGEYINPMLLLGGVPRAVLLPCC